MNPALLVKLRPAGPWRIGPDSGARNRVDVVYHSDSLYSAVTSALARLGSLDAWLDATARSPQPAVCFSSCFPFVDDVGLVVPPRTVWPPTSPALLATHLRWKSARFVPLPVVQAILAGQPLDASQWSVDGASECLVPAGAGGPFRTGIRWNAAVDRLSGVTERHSTACIEFRPGCGLWTAVSFRDESAHAQWLGPVKAAFRLLADTGFGGERSRGWGRAEMPEFIEGNLPELILARAEPISAAVREASPEAAFELAAAGAQAAEVAEAAADLAEAVSAMESESPAQGPATPAEEPPAALEATVEPAVAGAEASEAAAEVAEAVSAMESESPAQGPVPPAEEPPAAPEATVEPAVTGAEAAEAAAEVAEAVSAMESESPAPGPVPPAEEAPTALEAEPVPVPRAVPAMASTPGIQAHWLLSLFTPAPADVVDWGRGNYTLTARSGRVESPAGSGELKKQVQMVTEGSVVYAADAPRGAAPDVAPDGFAHPVFRAGFALSIPLPEVS